MVKVKSGKAAQQLADFLQTIDYVQDVEGVPGDTLSSASSFVEGCFTKDEKPSEFAGIWKKAQKIDAVKLRKQAWQRKK